MNARLRLSLMTTAVVVLGVLVVLVLARPGGSEAGAQDGIQHAGTPFQGASRNGVPSPEFRLRDQDGRATSIEAHRGRPVIVTFMYSTCEDTCPATARQIASGLDDLGEDVPTLIVSVDPVNDTASNAQAFLNKMGLRGRAQYLLGTRAQLSPVWSSYAIQEQGRGFEHSAITLILDGRGRQQVSFPTEQLTAQKLAHDVREVMDQDAAASAR